MDGYAKLATLMGAYPEIAIIRRFSALNAQSLLYLQAELVCLESQLRRYEEEDRRSGDQNRIDFALDFTKLSSTTLLEKTKDTVEGSPEIDIKGRRWTLILEIQKKLKDYNEAVLQQAALTQLKRPHPRDLRFLTEWMERPDMGNILLESQDSDVYENPDRLDLVVLKPRKTESLLTKWLSDSVIHWFHQKIGYRLVRLFSSSPIKPLEANSTNSTPSGVSLHPPEPSSLRLDAIAGASGITYYSQTNVLRLGRVVVMTLASLLPIGAIVILYIVQNMSKRLGIVAGFTAAFSLILGLLTNGELIDVFAASAAFAAVQVVFVGTTNTASSACSNDLP